MSKSRLPEDYAVEILKILPTKSLSRFRSVSKSWYSLITAPMFAKLRGKSVPRLLIYRLPCPQAFETINLENNELVRRHFPCNMNPRKKKRTGGRSGRFKIRGSCNGVICFGFGEKDLSLWNPTTGEVQSLPEAPEVPVSWICRFGLGWDKSEDFKVVRMLHDSNSETTRIEVLPLKTKTWVRRDDWVISYPVFYNLEEDKMVFCNGALHWLALDDDYKFVAGFDLAEQKFQFLPLRGSRNAFTTRIGVLGGDLYYGVSSPSCAEVWVMKEYGVESSWTDLGRVEQSGVSIDNFEPLALS